MRYHKYLKTEKWKEKRQAVFERALREAKCTSRYGICEFCGYIPRKSGLLEVHHLEYPKILGTESLDMLVLLCRKCHRKAHENREQFKENYMRVRKKKMEERRIEFEIKKNIGVLSESGSVRKELNIVSWNKEKPVIDLRNWERRNGTIKPYKGLTLDRAEATTLAILLNDFLDGNKPASEETKQKASSLDGFLGYVAD